MITIYYCVDKTPSTSLPHTMTADEEDAEILINLLKTYSPEDWRVSQESFSDMLRMLRGGYDGWNAGMWISNVDFNAIRENAEILNLDVFVDQNFIGAYC